MIWAIVPAKALDQAKTRLAPLLSQGERRALSLAMLREVLGALCHARNLDRVAVVTVDHTVQAVAKALGVEIIPEGRTGQNAALEDGLLYCREHGASALLVASADLPLLRPALVERLIERGMETGFSRKVLLAASRDGTGTNALFQRPPGVIPFLFGLSSLRLHQQTAIARDVHVGLIQERGWAFDVDTPADLIDLATSAGHTHAQALILQMHLLERMQAPLYGEVPIP
jgi:2-phospho-L-lactate guanylyltransferase